MIVLRQSTLYFKALCRNHLLSGRQVNIQAHLSSNVANVEVLLLFHLFVSVDETTPDREPTTKEKSDE